MTVLAMEISNHFVCGLVEVVRAYISPLAPLLRQWVEDYAYVCFGRFGPEVVHGPGRLLLFL